LRDEKDYHISEYVRYDGYSEDHLIPIRMRPEQLFADFFGIDLDKIENERMAILAALRGEQ
jgi:hypothetical protein